MSPALTGMQPDPSQPVYSGKDVFRWLEEGDEAVTGAYQEWLKKLVMVVYNLKITLDAEVIALGGGMTRNPRLVNDIRASLKETDPLLEALGFRAVNAAACRYGSEANLIGTAYNWFPNN